MNEKCLNEDKLILIKNGYVNTEVSSIKNPFSKDVLNLDICTLINNFVYYGFIPSMNLLSHLHDMSSEKLVKFWSETEFLLKDVTGANKEMAKYVVYKNFPTEVLEMSEKQYWTNQILIYFGFPVELFQDEEKNRPVLSERKTLKVLNVAQYNTLDLILENLINSPIRWNLEQEKQVEYLFSKTNMFIDISSAKFKENIISLASKFLKLIKEENLVVSNATDVLRLAAGMSSGDVSLRSNFKFCNFKRSERRFLLSKLNSFDNLLDDVAVRPELFKKFFRSLRPGDYNFPNVSSVYNELYNKKYSTFNSKVFKCIENKDLMALDLLKSRPGEFFRKFHHLYATYATEAVNALKDVVSQFSILQLVKLEKYVATIDDRKFLMYAPKGNWTKVKIEKNEKVPFFDKFKVKILEIINNELKNKLSNKVSDGILLDEKTKDIKLQTNDQEVGSYGRGTSFDIPKNITFCRTATYWQYSTSTVFFDNSWNFFDENWQSLGECNWSNTRFNKNGSDVAIFSGDAVNSYNSEGKACQMIDLYFEKLEKEGIRYAVWNVLSYSNLKFADADVLATLQYGENAIEGDLYEPSRAEVIFPLKGDGVSKFIAFIDIKERKLVYMDANFKANVQSASSNKKGLEEKMPAYVEYLNSLPSVYDLFKNAPLGKMPILYSDKDIEINNDIAYVFKKNNVANQFKDFYINDLLSEKHSHKNKLK
jgi:hypothetical protein